MRITALTRPFKDYSKAPINFLMLGKALIDLRGLKTLSVLKAFKFAPSSAFYFRFFYIKSNMPVQTTMKSSQFQPSLR